MTRWPRSLGAEERQLWQAVVQHVRPLDGRSPPAPELPAPPALAVSAAPSPAAPPPPPKRLARPSPVAAIPTPPPKSSFPTLERKVTRALARGRLQVDATVDLHGLTQADAHAVLIRFLHGSQARGCRLVQVVTGKGGPEIGFAGARGVLRRNVPHWLGLPGLRAIVVGFEEAAPHRGGAGALYVRLRRGSGGP